MKDIILATIGVTGAFLIVAAILVAALWPLWVALAAIKYVFGG